MLDLKNPKWFEWVDVKRLDIADDNYCLLGQLHGNYADGCDLLGITNNEDAENFGLMPRRFTYYIDGWRLTRAWRRRIAERPVGFRGPSVLVGILDEVSHFEDVAAPRQHASV